MRNKSSAQKGVRQIRRKTLRPTNLRSTEIERSLARSRASSRFRCRPGVTSA